MRNLFSKVAVATVAILATSLSASAKESITCRDFAKAAADEWAAGYMDHASDSAVANDDEVVVISYGKKYIAPLGARVGGDLRPISFGVRIQRRNKVYHEELMRCLHAKDIYIKVDDSLTQ